MYNKRNRSKNTYELYIKNWYYAYKVGIVFAMCQIMISKGSTWDGTYLWLFNLFNCIIIITFFAVRIINPLVIISSWIFGQGKNGSGGAVILTHSWNMHYSTVSVSIRSNGVFVDDFGLHGFQEAWDFFLQDHS